MFVSPLILVAEDNADLRRLIVLLLKEEGYAVVEAENGLRALQLFRKRRKGVKMLITDVTMPRMGGTELIQHARRLEPSLPVLVASTEATDLQRSDVDTDATRFLDKPFPLQLFKSMVKEMWDDVHKLASSQRRRTAAQKGKLLARRTSRPGETRTSKTRPRPARRSRISRREKVQTQKRR